MNVSLSAEAAEVVNEKLRNGEFQSAEEVVMEALRAFRRPPPDSVREATGFLVVGQFETLAARVAFGSTATSRFTISSTVHT